MAGRSDDPGAAGRPPADAGPEVIIVGGGIGGLGAALALSRQGLRVCLFEKSIHFEEVGAGLQLAPNCTRILERYGLLDEARSLGVTPEAMVMKDGLDDTELTRLDLRDVERRFGYPYLVIHRSDLHRILLEACKRQGVDLITDAKAVEYANLPGGASVTFADGTHAEAPVVIAADGLHSRARSLIIDDQPVSSSYVAYRGAVPMSQVKQNHIDTDAVVVHLGNNCHFVQYPLRGGGMFNQVAVFESPKALAGQEDWGTPDELDAAFADCGEPIRKGLPHMWRDR